MSTIREKLDSQLAEMAANLPEPGRLVKRGMRKGRETAKPKAKTQGRPFSRYRVTETWPVKGQPHLGRVIRLVGLESQNSVMAKDKIDEIRYWSIRKQLIRHLGNPSECAAPDPWQGIDYAQGRMAFGKPMESMEEIEKRRIA